MPLGAAPHGEPVVVHALRGALRCHSITHAVVVAPPDAEGMAQLAAALEVALPGAGSGAVEVEGRDPVPLTVVPGGAERADSVALGLRALPPEVDVVLVHDAARALTPVEVFDRVVAAVRAGSPAVTPALPVTDTVKEVGPGPSDGVETVVATLDRSRLRAVQTPQGFDRATLERAHAAAPAAALATDDCSLVEAAGGAVSVVPGSPRAMKVTTPADLTVAAAWLAEEEGSAGRDAGVSTAAGAGGSGAAAPALVVLTGHPAVGKTTISRALCRRLGAVHLRVDTVEQGLMRGGLPEDQLFAQGYGACWTLAADQLAVGLTVVADMVNGVPEAREEWERVASEAGARLVRVVVTCSDPEEHRRRVEGRAADIPGHRLPDWEETRTRFVAPWPEAEMRVDTATDSVDDAVRRIEEALR